MNLYLTSASAERPKDGSKNKVCDAMHHLPSGPYSDAYLQRVLKGLDGLNSVEKAHDAHKAKPLYGPPTGKDLRTVLLSGCSRWPSSSHQCSWHHTTRAGSTFVTAKIHVGSGSFPSRFCTRDVDLLHAVAHLLAPNTAALHGFEFVSIFIELAERFGLDSFTNKETKARVKEVFVARKIKTFKRSGTTLKIKTSDELIAELMKIHSNL